MVVPVVVVESPSQRHVERRCGGVVTNVAERMAHVTGVVGAISRKSGRIGVKSTVGCRPIAAPDPAEVVVLIGDGVPERMVVPVVMVETTSQRDLESRRGGIEAEALRGRTDVAGLIHTGARDSCRIRIRGGVSRGWITSLDTTEVVGLVRDRIAESVVVPIAVIEAAC